MATIWSIGLIELTPKQVEHARFNKIPRKVVDNRVRNQLWSVEKAIKTPLIIKHKNLYTPQDVEEAALNGISYNTFVTRVVTRGWDLVKAKTTPIIKPTFEHRKGVSQ